MGRCFVFFVFFPRANICTSLLAEAKEAGFSDRQIGKAIGVSEVDVRQKRVEANITPWVKQVRRSLSVDFNFVNSYLQRRFISFEILL